MYIERYKSEARKWSFSSFFWWTVKIFIILLARGIICKIVANILFIICHGKKFLKIKHYSIFLYNYCLHYANNTFIVRSSLPITSMKMLLRVHQYSCYLDIWLFERTSPLSKLLIISYCVDLGWTPKDSCEIFSQYSKDVPPKLNRRNLLRKRGPLKIDVEHYSALI